MAIDFNHTIVNVTDQKESARFVADILGLPEPGTFGPFTVVELGNGVNLDFMTTEGDLPRQHYAFLVSEEEFDGIFERIKERGVRYWADPHQETEGEINHNYGGRGVYFEDPSGHYLEAITAPYAE